MDITERFWSASLEELKRGYTYDEKLEQYICLVCGQSWEDGAVYRASEGDDTKWYEARKQAAHHLKEAHGSMLEYLLSLDKKAAGLTDLQRDLIRSFAAGMSDADIVKQAGSGSASTIRNHRFVLKEKAKQAKLLLAVMELMDHSADSASGASLSATSSSSKAVPSKFIPIHRTATQVDERYAITEAEYEALMKQYLPQGPQGPLTSFPRKEKRKIAILRHIATFFNSAQHYTEHEINEVLKPFWKEDYVTLRRYLIEYGYLGREADGSKYWVK
ncbi:DUF2087 domain-containing protein [Paenibacillus sp. GCM10023252]|uniref:DUF2087 domain-containing protein n=1 Tax=Paenibacillus sp. GCM10023252 TaxID=3252649 RepID=UPI003613F59C